MRKVFLFCFVPLDSLEFLANARHFACTRVGIGCLVLPGVSRDNKKKLAALQVSQKELAELVTEHLRKATRDLSSEDVGVIERHLDLLRSLTSAVQDVADTFGKMDSLAIPTGIEQNGVKLLHLLRLRLRRSMPSG